MNVSEELQAYFGPAAGRLGQVAGLGAAEAERVLREGLPLQLAALTEHARTPEGERQVAEAVQSLPRFASAEAALAGADAASTLQRAGQLLGPALLGPRAEAIARDVAGPSHPAGVQKLLQMALPLVLSFLGQRDSTERGPARIVVSARPPGGEASGDPAPEPAGAGLPPGPSPQALAGVLSAHLGGETAGRLGTLAGYGGASATRAVQAALPVVLGAVARKGRSEAGAGVLLGHSGDFERLVDAGGGLNPHLLDDPARVARIEGQGRGLLGTLFGTPSAVAGRLGSALGGSEEPAGRLLALLTPLVLGLLVGWARAQGLDARRLGALLAGLGPHLPGLLPTGLSGLGPLLNTEAVVAPVPAREAAAPGPPPGPPPAAPARRRGVPWWLIPLLLVLLAGGLLLLWSNPVRTPAAGAGITIGSPAPGATLPLADLTLRGTGRPGDTLSIEDGGLEVTSARVGADGTWQVTLSAPTLGEHVYTARGSGGVSGEVRVNVTAGDGPEPAASPDAGPTAPPRETFGITEPAPGARLPAGSFTLRGTGTPGESLQVLEDGTSLGNVTVGPGGTWSLDVPSPSPGAHTYAVYAEDATELGQVSVTVDAFDTLSAAGACDRESTLSLSDRQTVSQPFRFGGVGRGEGYRVTVRREGRVVGSRDIPLDPTCGWSYQSQPGAGRVTYEVRPLGSPDARLLSVVVTVRP